VLIGIFRSTLQGVDRKMSIWADHIDQMLMLVQSNHGKTVSIEQSKGCRLNQPFPSIKGFIADCRVSI
jgi:ABC-type sulfate transport system substrate-binding protein